MRYRAPWPLFASKSTRVQYPDRILLSNSLLDNTVRCLRSFGAEEECHEGIVYWAGVEAGSQWWLLACIKPDAVTTWGSYRTTAATNAKAILAARHFDLHLLAQVHSHPGKWVNHSQGDEQGAFMPFEGFLSIVVPNYGLHDAFSLDQCGIHRFERGRFRRLVDSQVKAIFRLVPIELTADE